MIFSNMRKSMPLAKFIGFPWESNANGELMDWL